MQTGQYLNVSPLTDIQKQSKHKSQVLHYIKVYDLPDMISYALNSSQSADREKMEMIN